MNIHGLTPKQRKFADEYIICGNATESAIKAGYSKKYANTNASKLLHNTTIKEYISKRLEEIESQKIATQKEVLEYLTSVVRGETTQDQLAVVAVGEGMSETKIEKLSVPEREKIKAAELLGKRFDAFTNSREIEKYKLEIEKLRQELDKMSNDNEKVEGYYELPARVVAGSFIDIHLDIIEEKYREYLLHGGRGSTKSSFISLEIVQLIKNDDSIHVLVVRKVKDTLRDSVFAQINWAIDVLNLNEEFEITKSPLEITRKSTGQKIYFRGADDPMKIKSIKPQFGYIGVVWFEELDQFGGSEEIRNIEQSALRGGDKSFIFKSYNPPKSKSNWANKYAAIPKESRRDHSSTYKGVPERWLGKAFIEEAEFLKEINPNAYEHEYLGIPNGSGGMVFENVEVRKITNEEINQFDRLYRGVDWGWYPDPWAYNLMHYDSARRTLYIFDEMRANKKGNRETYEMLKAKGVTNADVITCDSAENKSIEDYRDYGLNARAAVKGPGSVDYSMKWLQSLNKIVIDNERCPHTVEEFTNYEYERTKDGEIISGYPDKNNHHIDAVRYALNRLWMKKGV